MKRSYDDLREEYLRSAFDESEAAADPFEQFGRWFSAAVDEDVPLANACALATASAIGQPSSRMVLLKDFDERGFVFYTNYESRKGRELEGNPRAALLFWWPALERQIRIEGICSRVSDAESDGYFATRPRSSNVSAMASRQSERVQGRAELEEAVQELEDQWRGRDLERPEHWGGIRLVPAEFEFWQGRADRLHDRLRYRRQEPGSGPWARERLFP